MSIITSEIIINNIQANNRRRITEEHVDHIGGRHNHSYSCLIGHDFDAALLIHAVSMDERLKRREGFRVLRRISNGEPVGALEFNTPTEIRQASIQFREMLRLEYEELLSQKNNLDNSPYLN